ncbi:signal recognition particle protein [Acrasis kona]|uniref:Signal recognition particle protein n=1 Tax=Acrasis kona TaxID=1008807 RepID=A0AAW2Z3G5_9EUKA
MSVRKREVQHVIAKRTRESVEEYLIQWNDDGQPEWLGIEDVINYQSFSEKLLELGECVGSSGHSPVTNTIPI